MNHSVDLSVGGTVQAGRWEHTILHSDSRLSLTMIFLCDIDSDCVLYLDIDEQLPQVAWRHHQGRVELSDVAFVQSDVMVSCEPLE